MTFYMVTGIHQVRWWLNALANFRRQREQDRVLIAVENGQGVGVVPPTDGVVIIRSELGCAEYMNAALDWIASHASPGDWWCKCDSDDYYGPGYLESLHEAIDAGADVAGRCDLYVRTMHGHLWRQHRDLRGFVSDIPHGPTLAARVGAGTGRFPHVDRWGEDYLWCKAWLDRDHNVYVLPPEHMAYQRWPDNSHSWPCNDDELRQASLVPYEDLGDYDLSVVDGLTPPVVHEFLPAPPTDITRSMPYRIAQQELIAKRDTYPEDIRRILAAFFPQ